MGSLLWPYQAQRLIVICASGSLTRKRTKKKQINKGRNFDDMKSKKNLEQKAVKLKVADV